MKKNISIQGFEGSFHQVAVQQYFGSETDITCCSTFKEVVKNTTACKFSHGGMMAIENSIAGSILANYNLILKSNVKIVGEVYLPIKQQLMVYPGVKLEDIREVHSHHMAIQQCLVFLDNYDWKHVETEDTALSAKLIQLHKNKQIAAIASKLAAEIYGLDIIVSDIHTIKNNYTRFLILQHKDAEHEVTVADKASVNIITNHTKGSLASVLTIIAKYGVNLSKLQSMPIPGSNFIYSFLMDMEFENGVEFAKLIEKLKKITQQLTILGVYKNGTIL